MDDRNRQIPPQLWDWASGTKLARPEAGATCVLRVDLDPRPDCGDLEQSIGPGIETAGLEVDDDRQKAAEAFSDRPDGRHVSYSAAG